MTLPEETVHRPLPDLLRPEDGGLFAAELEKVLPAVSTRVVAGEFFPTGWQNDMGGWKGLVKRWLVRITTRRQEFVPPNGLGVLIATDRFSNGYFHWVTETLPRLWWIRDQLDHFQLLLPAFAARFPYMAESLALFPDLSFRVAESRTRLRLAEALLVPAVAPGGNYRPRFMVDLGEAWRVRAGAAAPFRKLYISRSRASRRRILNEDEVRGVLEAQGFETVHLEGLPFCDQVKLVAEASHLVSNHGAGLTNLMFMVPGSRVTEIRLRGDTHNNCYFSLARAVGVEYEYRLAEPADQTRTAHTADLIVDPKELA